MCVKMDNKNQKRCLGHNFLFSLPPSRETMQRRHCWRDLSHPTYVLALSSTNRSAELSPPPTGRAYIKRRWTLGAQSTLGGCRGRWGGGVGKAPSGKLTKFKKKRRDSKNKIREKKTFRELSILWTNGTCEKKTGAKCWRETLQWLYIIKSNWRPERCNAEQKPKSEILKMTKKRAKSRKTKPKKKETKENLEVHIEEELGPVQWKMRRIETREEKISLRWVCL